MATAGRLKSRGTLKWMPLTDERLAMSDWNKLFGEMISHGQDMAKKMGMDPDAMLDAAKNMPGMEQLRDMMPDSVEEMFQGTPDPKMLALCSVSGLVARGVEDTAQFTTAVNAALEAGASPFEITGAINQMLTLGAVEGVAKGLPLAMAAIAAKGMRG